ncbi:Peptide chain release factor 2 [compost metagenome]|jgi:peptide chain release factor|uniref:peptide chain release factor H n=1 Tax=Sphingobacterium faecium TaxID=34087 RepID=UPI000F96ABA8|nr:peptide chain release factor H [Sphingobacterium faecium]MQP29049.1 peptide chain release factor H [Sphingobacterium faecium]
MEVYIQLSSGKGPKECDFFLTHVLGIFQREALAKQIHVMVINEDKSGSSLIQSVVCKLTGAEIDIFLQAWKGSLLWICESPFRRFHKRKNWFIALFVITKEKEIILLEKDILYQVMRSSGAGGQHVNKVSSAVRALHMPTGITAVAMDTRSQLQNKKLAKERLAHKLMQLQNESAQQDVDKQWQNHAEIERGNPTRVFKGIDFKS